MTTGHKHIRLGHFDNFSGENSILISADIHGLLELEDLFLKLSKGLSNYDFSDLKLLDHKFRINLKAYNDRDNLGLRQTSIDNYEWRVTTQKWGEFREKLTAMYRNLVEGHLYLDSDSKDNQEISKSFME